MDARVLLLFLVSLLAVGCGGNSGDDLNVTGVWRGPLLLAENTCTGTTPPATMDAVHGVIIRGEEVVLDDENGVRYVGNAVGNDGFSVDAVGSNFDLTGDGGRCDFTLRIEYHEIDGDNDPTARVEQFFQGTCDNADCTVRYEGATVRTLGIDS